MRETIKWLWNVLVHGNNETEHTKWTRIFSIKTFVRHCHVDDGFRLLWRIHAFRSMGYTLPRRPNLDSHFVDKLNINGLHYIRVRCAHKWAQLKISSIWYLDDLVYRLWEYPCGVKSGWIQSWPLRRNDDTVSVFISRAIFMPIIILFLFAQKNGIVFSSLRYCETNAKKNDNEELNKAIRCIKFAIVGEIHG